MLLVHKTVPSQKKAEQLTLWVKPIVKAELQRTLIQQAIAKHMRSISTRLAWLLVRVAFDAGQTRSLVTNILGRQPGVTPEVLKTILERSGRTAKGNITRRTPQIVELIEVIEKWILTSNEKGQEG